MKRLLAAISVGSVLMAGAYGFAASQTFTGGQGLAAQGAAAAQVCSPALKVQYDQTNGVVVGVFVDQVPGGDCAGKAFHASVRDGANVEIGAGSGVINVSGAVVNIPNVVDIVNTVVTITDF